MNVDSLFQQRLVCVAVIDQPEDAVPLTEALLAGGLNCIEVTFRTTGAAIPSRTSAKRGLTPSSVPAHCSPPTMSKPPWMPARNLACRPA